MYLRLFWQIARCIHPLKKYPGFTTFLNLYQIKHLFIFSNYLYLHLSLIDAWKNAKQNRSLDICLSLPIIDWRSPDQHFASLMDPGIYSANFFYKFREIDFQYGMGFFFAWLWFDLSILSSSNSDYFY